MNIFDKRDIGRTGLEIVCGDYGGIIRAKPHGFWQDVIEGTDVLYQRKMQEYDFDQWDVVRRTDKLVKAVMGKAVRGNDRAIRH